MNVHLEYSESKWMSQFVLVDDERAPTTTLHIHAGESVQLRVHPVEPLVQQVCGGRRVQNRSDHNPDQADRKRVWSLPRVMPLGQTMLSVTRAERSPPLRPPLSIFAGFPQSVQ